jgi:hypothetical protein
LVSIAPRYGEVRLLKKFQGFALFLFYQTSHLYRCISLASLEAKPIQQERRCDANHFTIYRLRPATSNPPAHSDQPLGLVGWLPFGQVPGWHTLVAECDGMES